MRKLATRSMIATALVCAAIANAQSSPPTRAFVVTDQKSGQPIAGAEVRDSASGKTAITNASGAVVLGFVTPLRPRFPYAGVTVRKVGYKPLTLLVPLTDTTTLTGEMEPAAPTELPAVVSTEHYRLDLDPGKWDGFGARCQAKHVSCFDDTTLAARPSYRLFDVLMKADGILENCGGGGAPRFNSTPTCIAQMRGVLGGRCSPNYFVDGFEWLGSVWDLETSFGPAQLKGIEVYRSEQPRPLRFTGKSPVCGAIVLWSR